MHLKVKSESRREVRSELSSGKRGQDDYCSITGSRCWHLRVLTTCPLDEERTRNGEREREDS